MGTDHATFPGPTGCSDLTHQDLNQVFSEVTTKIRYLASMRCCEPASMLRGL